MSFFVESTLENEFLDSVQRKSTFRPDCSNETSASSPSTSIPKPSHASLEPELVNHRFCSSFSCTISSWHVHQSCIWSRLVIGEYFSSARHSSVILRVWGRGPLKWRKDRISSDKTTDSLFHDDRYARILYQALNQRQGYIRSWIVSMWETWKRRLWPISRKFLWTVFISFQAVLDSSWDLKSTSSCEIHADLWVHLLFDTSSTDILTMILSRNILVVVSN